MSRADALALPWAVAVPVLGLLGFVAVLLLGLAIVGQIRR